MDSQPEAADTTSNQRTALVTGANRGIGLAICRALKDTGMRVIGTARTPDSAFELERVANKVVTLDVADADSVDQLARSLADETIDVLINNAGVALDKWQSALELDIDVYRQTMEANLYGPLRLCQLLVPKMRERGFGRVVNISSELGSLSQMEMGMTLAYRSSKSALNAFTVILARELAEAEDIQINAACPGWVQTELGGDDAPLTVEQGADTAVWLATRPRGFGSGGLYRERETYPW